MHHWPLIRQMLLEFLDQRRQFTHPSCSFKPHNSSRCGLGHQLRPRLLRERTRRGKKTPFRMAATQLGHHSAAWRSPEGSNAVKRTVVTLPRYQGSGNVGFADRVFDSD